MSQVPRGACRCVARAWRRRAASRCPGLESARLNYCPTRGRVVKGRLSPLGSSELAGAVEVAECGNQLVTSPGDPGADGADRTPADLRGVGVGQPQCLG